MSNRKEGRKQRENTNQKAPDGFSRLEVFEEAATKKDDHNHPNSLQRVDYRNVNNDISGNMIKDSMIRAHKIILEQTKIDLYTRFAHVCSELKFYRGLHYLKKFYNFPMFGKMLLN